MIFMKKLLSVAVALSLCASLAAPAFAASFDDLQDAVSGNTETGTRIEDSEHEDHYGYDSKEDGSYGVESWKNETGGRDVQLNEDVVYNEGDKEDKNTTITIEDNDNVTIDLNGNSIDGGYKAADENGAGGSEGSKDSVITVDGGKLTIKDSSEKQTGTITGGNADGLYHENKVGGGVYVDNGGKLTLDGGSITGNNARENGGGVCVDEGEFTMNGGSITNNTTGNSGGGVYINTELAAQKKGKAEFVMNDGVISNNVAGSLETGLGSGGGIGAETQRQENFAYTKGYESIVINGGTIEKNTAGGSGGGIFSNNGTIKIDGQDNAKVVISGNTAGNYGGGIYSANSETRIEDAVISGNKTTNTTVINNNGKKVEVGYGGGVYTSGSTVTMTGNTVSDNTASFGGGAMIKGGKGTLTDNTISANHAGNGGGVYAWNIKDLTVTGGAFSGNGTLTGSGGAIFVYNSVVDMNCEISGNQARHAGAGVYVGANSVFTMSGGKLYGNTAVNHSDDLYSNGKATKVVLLIPAESMGVSITSGEKTRPVSGWYGDSQNHRWGNDYTAVVIDPEGVTGVLSLKAAHDEYFNVVYTDGVEDEELFEDQVWEVENKSAVPGFSGEDPVRPGYTFSGWTAIGDIGEDGTVTGAITMVAQWTPIPVIPEEPVLPDAGDDTDAGDDAGTTIDEGAVPLASGPVTRAEFVDYLWRHEGQPAPVEDSGLFEDVTEEHVYSPAVAWAKSIGIIKGYQDGTFAPDDLVTVAAARSILTSYAAYLGIQMPALTTLVGEDDEPVLNCDEVIGEFFGE